MLVVLIRVMKKVLIGTCMALVGALPEEGCYYYEFPSQGYQTEAQIEVKKTNTLDFNVYFNAPNLNLVNELFPCTGEKFTWDETSSTMVVGQNPVSSCFSDLIAKTAGAVTTPVNLVFDPTAKTFTTKIIIPVKLTKRADCRTYVLTTTTATPTGSTVSQNPAADGQAQSNTNHFITLSYTAAVAAMLIALVQVTGFH
jgi:hypothetical protein